MPLGFVSEFSWLAKTKMSSNIELSRHRGLRIVLLVNNWLGWQVVQWLKSQGETIVGLVVHPGPRRKYGDEILESACLEPEQVFDASELGSREVLQAIKALKPDIGVSILFDYILKQEFLDLMPAECINLHPSLLPYNRGNYPNVWSIVENTPAGATLHYLDSGIDTGDLIMQREVVVEPIDTGETLYHKLEEVCLNLFKEAWPLIRIGQAPRVKQPREVGTYHARRDVSKIDEIDLDATFTARNLINIIRARTFSSYEAAYFREAGRKVYLRLQLQFADDLGAISDGNDNSNK